MLLSNSFAARCRRLLRHCWTTSAHGRRHFPPATLSTIGAAIAQGEQSHRAQLRLIVESALGLEAVWRGVSNRERALALFAEYAIWDTEDNCGVLIYVNLAERMVEIVTDRAIGRQVERARWDAICQNLTRGYARGLFHDGTLTAIAQVNALLCEHFPADGTRANELPDAPIVL